MLFFDEICCYVMLRLVYTVALVVGGVGCHDQKNLWDCEGAGALGLTQDVLEAPERTWEPAGGARLYDCVESDPEATMYFRINPCVARCDTRRRRRQGPRHNSTLCWVRCEGPQQDPHKNPCKPCRINLALGKLLAHSLPPG